MDTTTRSIGLVLALGGLIAVIDTTVTIAALPALVTALESTLPTMSWVTTGYLMGIVAVIPMAGWLAARFGDKAVYLAALAVFVVGSVAAGFAWNAGSLIVARVVQGLGGGLLNPIGMAIALRSVPPRSRGAIMSLLGLPVILGPVLGPPLAGFLTDMVSWRWIFWINIPIGASALYLCRRHLPRSQRGEEGRVVDWRGLVQVTSGGALLVLGCTVVGEAGRLGLSSLAAIVAGLALIGLFVRHAIRIPHPLVHVRLLARRPMAVGALVLGAFAAGYFGSMTLVPAFVQGVRGDSVTLTGMLAIPTGLAVGLTLQVATRLVDHTDARRVVMFGTGTALAGLLSLGVVIGRDGSYIGVAAAAATVGVGSGATLMPMMTTASRWLEGPDIPRGTTLLNLISQLGAAVGIALVATTLTIMVGRRAPKLDASDQGGLGAMVALDPLTRSDLRPDLAIAVGLTYVVPALFVLTALVSVSVGLREGDRTTRPVEPVTGREAKSHKGGTSRG